MKIERFLVKSLFGIFDHEIPLSKTERVTIIHGINGVGKTAMLRLLDGFFNSRYAVLRTIPFDSFAIYFDDKSHIEIKQKLNTSGKRGSKNELTFIFTQFKMKPITYPVEAKISEDFDIPVRLIEQIIPQLRQVDSDTWEYMPTGEFLALSEVLERFSDRLPINSPKKNEPEWLQKLKELIHIRLIESQRLLNFVSNKSSRAYNSTTIPKPTVSAYSEELASQIKAKLTEYAVISQSLDKTFPKRVLQQQGMPNLTEPQLRSALDALDETRSRLIEVGLLDKDETPDSQIQNQRIDDSTKNLLSVYVKDTEEKLDVFSEIAAKINLLRKIINEKFSYSRKEMKLSKDKGFIFQSLYTSSLPQIKSLSPTDLLKLQGFCGSSPLLVQMIA